MIELTQSIINAKGKTAQPSSFKCLIQAAKGRCRGHFLEPTLSKELYCLSSLKTVFLQDFEDLDKLELEKCL